MHPGGYVGRMESKIETTIVYWGNIGIMENKMETTIVYWGNIGMVENKMETTIVYWGNIGIMENKMETAIASWGNIGIMENRMDTMHPKQVGGSTLTLNLIPKKTTSVLEPAVWLIFHGEHHRLLGKVQVRV